MRVFVGIPLDDAARAALAPVLASLHGARVPDVRDLHVTLQFLGEVAPERVDAIAAALAPLASSPGGVVALRGLGTFPERGRPRVVHAHVDDATSLLAGLASRTAELLAPLGFAREARPFHPHVTLARVDGRARERGVPRANVDVPRVTLDVTLPVHAVVLFESKAGAPPRYHALHTIPLVTSTSVRAGPGRQETHDHRPPA